MSDPIDLDVVEVLLGCAVSILLLTGGLHLLLLIHGIRRDVETLRELLIIWARLWGAPADVLKAALAGYLARRRHGDAS